VHNVQNKQNNGTLQAYAAQNMVPLNDTKRHVFKTAYNVLRYSLAAKAQKDGCLLGCCAV
jgi:hypothetical protein